MGAKQCCGSQIFIRTSQSISNQISQESQFTNDIDVLRKAIIQPIKPLPLNRLESLKEVRDEDIDDIFNHFNELEKE
ncbi:unnamed protein product (macronuclear) [Paramecium tetraurelia]|uniref:Uncharacterized protein n=1 Tax=Paramecium tetraurelia TaxID=5888 RepID=A0EHC4_PARTE|nr:uncharacterized protein GSPATT00027039001 [Paramecium tetraurelia]CAK94715.1 unnamed protein product [Paramecium tetraurelia]|eukprot:XP_001462088.1 hypothetical protein (macronuclear) [Paramecium tetraurelia strain d4-2]